MYALRAQARIRWGFARLACMQLSFWLGVNGSVTIQQVKALADKVAARLP